MLLIFFRAGVNTAHHISDSIKLMLKTCRSQTALKLKTFHQGFS